MQNLKIGDKVKLTASMKAASVEPERYQEGIITDFHSWKIVEVQWNGHAHPICMRLDEIEKAE